MVAGVPGADDKPQAETPCTRWPDSFQPLVVAIINVVSMPISSLRSISSSNGTMPIYQRDSSIQCRKNRIRERDASAASKFSKKPD